MKKTYFKYLFGITIVVTILAIILFTVFLFSNSKDVSKKSSKAGSSWNQALIHTGPNSPFTDIRGSDVVSCNGFIYIPRLSQVTDTEKSSLSISKYETPGNELASIPINHSGVQFISATCLKSKIYVMWSHSDAPATAQYHIQEAIYDVASNSLVDKGDISALLTQTNKLLSGQPKLISTGDQLKLVFSSGDQESHQYTTRLASSIDGDNWNVDAHQFGGYSDAYKTGNPDMSLDGNHVVFADNNGFFVSDFINGSWSSPTNIPTTADRVLSYFSIDVSDDGYDYVAWQQSFNGVGAIALAYKKFDDKQFKVIENISNNKFTNVNIVLPHLRYSNSNKQLSIFWTEKNEGGVTAKHAFNSSGILPQSSKDIIVSSIPFAPNESSQAYGNIKSIYTYLDKAVSKLYYVTTLRDSVSPFSTWTAIADISSPFGGVSPTPTSNTTLPTPTSAPVLGQCTSITSDNPSPSRNSLIHLTTVLSPANAQVSPYDWYYSIDESSWFNYSGGGQPPHNSTSATTSFSDLAKVPTNIQNVYYTIGDSTNAGVGAGGPKNSLKYTCEIKVVINNSSSTPTPSTKPTPGGPTNSPSASPTPDGSTKPSIRGPSPVVTVAATITPSPILTTNQPQQPTSTTTPTNGVTSSPPSSTTYPTSVGNPSPTSNNPGTSSNCTNVSNINVNTNTCSGVISVSNPFTFSGTTSASSTVNILVGGNTYQITSSSSGNWNWSSSSLQLNAGQYDFTINYIDPTSTNQVSKSISIKISNLPNTGITDTKRYMILVSLGLVMAATGSILIMLKRK